MAEVSEKQGIAIEVTGRIEELEELRTHARLPYQGDVDERSERRLCRRG